MQKSDFNFFLLSLNDRHHDVLKIGIEQNGKYVCNLKKQLVFSAVCAQIFRVAFMGRNFIINISIAIATMFWPAILN